MKRCAHKALNRKIDGISTENVYSEVEVDFGIVTCEEAQGDASRISVWLLVMNVRGRKHLND